MDGGGGTAVALFEEGPLLVIVIVVLLLFGAAAIPKLARSLGRAKGEFQRAKGEFEGEVAKSATAPVAASEEQVVSTARGLGIDTAGKSVDELKRLIQQKMA